MAADKRPGSAQWRLFYAMLGYGAAITVIVPLVVGLLVGRGWQYYVTLALLGMVLVGFVTYVILKYTLRYTLNSFLNKFNPLIEQPLPKPGNPLRSTELDNMEAFFGSLSAQLSNYIATTVARLSTSEQRLNRLYETMACGVVVWDAALQVTHVNQGAAKILGLQPGQPRWDQAGGPHWTVRSEDGMELSGLEAPARHALRTGQSHSPCTLGLFRPEADPIWIEGAVVPMRDSEGVVEQIIFSFMDFSGRKRAEDDLAHQAMHDALTGLPNRTLLADRVKQAILAARRDARPFALMVMDLDRFKEVNDAFGHHYGDLLLREIGPRLTSALRESDTVARLGGDEFAVLLPGSGTPEGATLAGQKIVSALEEQFLLDGQAVEVGASIGIALYPEHGEDVETLMRRADVAMYTAKHERSGYIIYGDDQDPHSASRLTLRGELRRAIEHDELTLYYQPKVHFSSHDGIRVEALVRWRHPQRGLVPPDDFIPLAEQSGLIKPLTEWVLDSAAQQCRRWRDGGLEVIVAVNLSMRNLQDAQLPAIMRAALDRWGIDPAWLNAEITESVIMANPTRALDIITRLSAMGIVLSIDDFGTGYSSLAYLKRLPVSELKIDKSFVKDMLSDENDAVIVRSTIDLGHNLGLTVVAEGVEDQGSWEQLGILGCDAAQGYHMGRPMPSEAFERWLLESPWSRCRLALGEGEIRLRVVG